MVGIYKVTNMVNNKIYIGKSKDIQRRWREHHTEPFNTNCRAYDVIFYRAIRKYGIDNFKFEIIEECSEAELNEREKYWIKFYNTCIKDDNGSGYNMTEGGENTSQELKYDIELIQKLWLEGKTQQEILQITHYSHNVLTRYLDYLEIDVNERRRRGSLYKAKTIHQYNLNGTYIQSFSSVSEAARALQQDDIKASTSNISYACNGKTQSAYGYLWSYIKKDMPEKKIRHTKVNQYSLDGKYIKTYNTLTEAAKENNINNISTIINVCTGKRKTAGGYIWKYYNNSLDNPYQNVSPVLKNAQQKNIKESNKRKAVDQFDTAGNYISTYQNMKLAAEAVNLKNYNNIWKACNGEQKTAGGYIWRYSINEHKEVQE